MGIFARLCGYLTLFRFAAAVLVVAAPPAFADAPGLNQKLPRLESLRPRAARQSTAEAALATAEPVCDIFANGYDPTGATPCAGCFDGTMDFNETDIDCGGGDCLACAAGKQCVLGADCQSGTCTNNLCVASAGALVISQVQTRGSGGGNDEFVELYNPTSTPVTFDSSWTLGARSATGGLANCATAAQGTRFTGTGQVIPPHGHLLYVNSTASGGYDGATAGDATYTTGIPDAASVVLEHASTVVDALCFYFDMTTQDTLAGCATAYACEGTPVMNPHDNTNTTGSNVDASLERKPGGAGGNTTNTGDNASDFIVTNPSDPHNLSSTPVP